MSDGPTVLISDVHMDAWEKDLGAEGARAKRQRFGEFFTWVADSAEITRLVIGGDLLDVPQKTGHPLLPTYADVLEGLATVAKAGKAICYVIGNHDSGIVGLSIDTDDPPVRIGYPSVRVRSGDKTFLVEHGHLYDPWLWEYVRYTAELVLRRAPAGGGVLGLAGGAEGGSPADAEELRAQTLRAWQSDRGERAERDEAAASLASAIERELDDYEDREAVAALLAGARGPALEGAFGVAPAAAGPGLLEQLVAVLYAGPHWRRVAAERIGELRRDPATSVDGVVMGHTHNPEERLVRVEGADYPYINSGSWRHDAADIVWIDGGTMKLHRRTWDDDWPG